MSASLPSAEELHVRRFERAFAERVAAGFHGQRLKVLKAGPLSPYALKLAWSERDPKTFAGLCLALQAHGELYPHYRLRFAGVLLNQDRFEEALAVLRSPSGDAERLAFDEAHLLARALAGAGRTQEALEVCGEARQALRALDLGQRFDDIFGVLKRTACALDRSARWRAYRDSIERQLARGKRANAVTQLGQFLAERAGWLEDALTAIAALQARGQPPASWPETRRLVERAVVLGLHEPAALWLGQALEGSVALSADERDEVFELALAVCAPLQAGEIARLTSALTPACLDDRERQALADAASVFEDADDRRLEAARAPGLRKPLRAFMALAAAAAGRPRAAIELFGPLSMDQDNQRFNTELARCTGIETIRRMPFRSEARAERRIFDLFPFNGETHLLDIKLDEMAGWVDRFVIVESRKTFTGLEKPLYFEAVRERYAPFRDKIEYVVIDDFPDHVNAAWAREFHQRDRAVAGIADICAPDDLVLLTDVDEIIDRRALEGFQGEFAGLKMQTFRYFLNYRQTLAPQAQHGNASVWRGRYLRMLGSSYARVVLRAWMKGNRIVNAGWHFTSVNDAAGIANKIRSYSHQENTVRKGVAWDEGFFSKTLGRIRAGQLEPGWERVELDDGLPAYVCRNRDELAGLIL